MKKKLKPRKMAVQERSRATVDAILESATHILSENESDELSTNRIAERAGVSVGSLYQYFPGKDAILSALTQRLIESRLASIEKKLVHLVDSGAKVETTIEVFVDFIVEMKIKNLKFERALTAYLIRNGDFTLSTRLDEEVIEKISVVLEPIRKQTPGFDAGWSVFMLFHAIRGIILSTSIQRPHRMKEPALKREMTKLVRSYLMSSG